MMLADEGKRKRKVGDQVTTMTTDGAKRARRLGGGGRSRGRGMTAG
jgi:hypothetical protein